MTGRVPAPETMAAWRGWYARLEPWFLLSARILLAALFIWSAWHKLVDPDSFLVKVYEYDFPPQSWADYINARAGTDFQTSLWVEPFAAWLPRVMVAAGVLAAVGFLTRPAALAFAGMLLLFLLAIGVNVYRDRVLGCGCFSEEGHQVGWALLLQDGFLVMVCAYLVFRGGGFFSADGFLRRRFFDSSSFPGESKDLKD